MSDEPRDLQRRLEQATAADFPADTPLEPETAALREAWLAFAALLEATGPAPLEKLRSEQEITVRFGKGTVPFSLRENRDSPPVIPGAVRTRRRLAAVAALAASVAVAVTLIWNGMRQPAGPPPLADGPASPDIEQPAPDAKQPRQALAANDVDQDADQFDWDDSLDEQIVQVGREIVRVQQDWYHLDDAFEPIQHGLQQMAEDIEDNML